MTSLIFEKSPGFRIKLAAPSPVSVFIIPCSYTTSLGYDVESTTTSISFNLLFSFISCKHSNLVLRGMLRSRNITSGCCISVEERYSISCSPSFKIVSRVAIGISLNAFSKKKQSSASSSASRIFICVVFSVLLFNVVKYFYNFSSCRFNRLSFITLQSE